MKQESLPRIFAAEQISRWRNDPPGIWSLKGADLDDLPALSILTTLWDQPRWLEAYHLYDQRGSELFEEICRLPEYYLTRTENGILETRAADIIAAAPVECVVELGAGYSKKTVHLLTEQTRRRGRKHLRADRRQRLGPARVANRRAKRFSPGRVSRLARPL